MTTLTKQTIINALRTFSRQRPGLEFGNYGDVKAYRSELRGITKDLAEAQTLLRAIELRDSITAEDLLRGFDAFSGRLSIDATTGRLDYCTGQYFPTEYRRAVCSVCASVLWAYWRENMPKTVRGGPADYTGPSAGELLHRTARNEFGRGIAGRWFN